MTCENINLLPRRAVNLERQSIIHPALLSLPFLSYSCTHFLTHREREERRDPLVVKLYFLQRCELSELLDNELLSFCSWIKFILKYQMSVLHIIISV